MANLINIFVLFLSVLLCGCLNFPDASVQKCFKKELNDFDLDCVVGEALKKDDISVCASIGPPSDDLCVGDFIIKKNDPSVCEKLEWAGTKENCEHYYFVKQNCKSSQGYAENCVADFALSKNREDICYILSQLHESEDKMNNCIAYYREHQN